MARFKEIHPNVITLFGGSNFEGEMGVELARSNTAIDYAVRGEGDQAFPEFLLAAHEGRNPTTVPGVFGKPKGEFDGFTGLRPMQRDMDALPFPDDQDYFRQRDEVRSGSNAVWPESTIHFESARGCWWSEKQHRTF